MKELNTLSPLLLCLVFHHALFASPYRTRTSGDWSAVTTWEMFDGAWGVALAPPGAGDEVTIRGGHTVNILLTDASAFFLHILSGASLELLGTARSLTIGDGNPAADLIVEGLFRDNASSGAGNGINFDGAATWRLGPAGTILRTNNSSAAKYRDHYHGGMSNIPASAHWIVRYVGLGDPAFTTVNTFYPNLTFESVSGQWAPLTGFSQFTGFSGTAVIKGNLDIGGNGSGTVTILNENYNADPIAVLGMVMVREGSVLTNQSNVTGTGFRVAGPLIIDGLLDVSGGVGVLHLNGAGLQNVAGAGTVLLRDLEINNQNGVNLLRPLTVNNDLIFFDGRILLNENDLGVWGDLVGFGPGRYVQTNAFGPGAGALVRPTTGSQIFPVGNNSYNLAIVESGGGETARVRVEDRVLSEGDSGDQLISQVVNRTWWVGGVDPGFSLTLQWNAGDQMLGFDPGQCYLLYYDNGWWGDGPAPANGNGPYLRTRTNLPGSGPFALASGGALPVELIRFQARAEGNRVRLTWETATELNNDFMAIERSPDGRVFTEVGRVPGAGTTFEPRIYQFMDEDPLPGISYYRLRQVDYDGTATYHEIATVRLEAIAWDLWVFPVPAADYLRVGFPDKLEVATPLLVMDNWGRVVLRTHVPTGVRDLNLDLADLPSGVYFIQLFGDPLIVKAFVKG